MGKLLLGDIMIGLQAIFLIYGLVWVSQADAQESGDAQTLSLMLASSIDGELLVVDTPSVDPSSLNSKKLAPSRKRKKRIPIKDAADKKERNKRAAQRFRDRRQKEIVELEEKLKFLEQANSTLATEAEILEEDQKSLRAQISDLLEIVLNHNSVQTQLQEAPGQDLLSLVGNDEE